jgi:hypothetical protein
MPAHNLIDGNEAQWLVAHLAWTYRGEQSKNSEETLILEAVSKICDLR